MPKTHYPASGRRAGVGCEFKGMCEINKRSEEVFGDRGVEDCGLRVGEHDVGRAEGPAHVAQIPVTPEGEHAPCNWVIQAMRK